ncbi:MAG: group II intron reverse transcriptase domain-containing protein [Candidatus Aenigmarchaeota archaeon]|nr:group II intron reverse transcriptase domain-containing protein [Candidatus Aenigmarchaeota archaeon]
MKTHKHLWENLCTFENLEQAYEQARRGKYGNPVVVEFRKHWQLHLCTILKELRTHTYKPRPLRKFVLRDPKTRVICVSEFRDRVIHHALVNILQPVFEPLFIHDSYASRKGKGTLPALKRFDIFKWKITSNCTRGQGFVFKADIKHYFETVDHAVLLRIIQKRVKDENIIWLIRQILDNYDSGTPGKGMPLGNWTSQFFANVYLNELDQFVKHILRAKYYVRYVDDFVILHKSKKILQEYEQRINEFLQTLKINLHPTKCKIIPLGQGISFLGFRIFYHHKLLRKRNIRKIKAKLAFLLEEYESGWADAYDVLETLHGWNAYAVHGNTFRLRQRLDCSVKKELETRTKTRSAFRVRNT